MSMTDSSPTSDPQLDSRVQSVIMANIKRADGSSLYSFGETVFQCLIYGPYQITLGGKELVDKAHLEVIYKSRVKPAERDDPHVKLIEDYVYSNLSSIMLSTLHPRTGMTIFLQEMQSDGSQLACALNAACFALLDSGFPMKSPCFAISAIIDDSNDIVVNPTDSQTLQARSSFDITFDNKENIISITTNGSFIYSQFKQVLKACKESTRHIFEFYRTSLEKRYKTNK